VIGGKITRAEILRQFSPESQQRSCLDAMKIDLLLTTDLLSEGVNLQDAAVAIHLDLPWTHARIEQRTGRIARLGSRHRSVAIYGFKPPKSADDFLRSSSLVERKLLDSVGVAAQPAMHERVRATISRWKATSSTRTARVPLVAAVQSQHDGFLALVICGARPQLICWSGDRITDQAFEVAMSCECAEGISARVLPHEARAAVAAVAQWLLRQSAASAAGLGADSYLAGRRRLIAGIDSVAARSSPARRSRMLRLVAVARDVATRTHGASVESELAELASAELRNEEWLRRISELGSAGRKRSAVSGTAILAVLLLTRSPLKGGMCK
jgi:Superfamily II DNA/RNA helicases, SNF2 family